MRLAPENAGALDAAGRECASVAETHQKVIHITDFMGVLSFEDTPAGRPEGPDEAPAGLQSAALWAQIGRRFLRRVCFMSSNIVHLSDDTFEDEVLNCEVPVLVDYWAEWCGPCKAIASIVDEIAEEYAGELKVAKLNIDDNNATPPRYGIRGIPTLMLFKDGNVEATKVGAVSKTQLSAFIDANL